jgi:hypothetical protein
MGTTTATDAVTITPTTTTPQPPPWYENPAFYVSILAMVLPPSFSVLGFSLSPQVLAAMIVMAVTYVVSHHVVSATTLWAQIKADSQKTVAAMAPTTPDQAIAALNNLVNQARSGGAT